jgi:hypothetical protein
MKRLVEQLNLQKEAITKETNISQDLIDNVHEVLIIQAYRIREGNHSNGNQMQKITVHKKSWERF